MKCTLRSVIACGTVLSRAYVRLDRNEVEEAKLLILYVAVGCVLDRSDAGHDTEESPETPQKGNVGHKAKP